MAKMTLEKLLVLDLRVEGNEELLKTGLSKLKWLERFEADEITIDVLEKLYSKLIKKYPAHIGYIQDAGDNSWVFMIKHKETHTWINTVYGITLFEGMAKTILTFYGYFIKENPFHDTKRGNK